MARGLKTGGRVKNTPNRITKIGLSSSNIPAIKGLYEALIGSIKGGGFYVYSHEHKWECFYIGKGCNNRAWDKATTARNEKWNDYASAIGYDYEVKIIAADITEQEALAIEECLIKKRLPVCNINLLF